MSLDFETVVTCPPESTNSISVSVSSWNVERRERSERQIQAVSSRASRSRPSNWMACSFSLYFWILPLAVVG